MRVIAGCVATGLALVAGLSSRAAADEKTNARTRVELLRFAEILELAAGKVSRPSPFQVMGPATGGSSYLLPGYGAIFVLPARALPSEGGMIVVHDGPPGSQPVIGFWRRDGKRSQKPKDGARVREVPEPPEMKELDRDLQQIGSLVALYAREAERASQEAEKAMDRVAQEIRVRFPEMEPAPATPPAALTAPPAPAAPGNAPAAPVSGPPVAAPAAPAPLAATPPAAPTAPMRAPPAAPPWRFWFQADDEGDPRPPEQVVSEVKNAVIQALESRGGLLTIVKPEDFLVVAVDFTARGFPLRPERRAERTLIVKAKKRDLDERRAGRIGADELRKRIETDEY